MVRIIICAVIVLIGAGGGFGAGMMLRPAPEMAEAEGGEMDGEKKEAAEGDEKSEDTEEKAEKEGAAKDEDTEDEEASEEGGSTTIVKMNNQFVVPILKEGRVSAMLVMSLSLETDVDAQELAFSKEPKLRDAFLQVLFDHANAGGFDGTFTGGDRLDQLRRLLRASTRKILGDVVHNVLVTDIARQDM